MPLIDVTTSSFDNQVLAGPKLVLVDFWAPWCGPCKSLAPVVEGIADEHSERISVVKVDIDANPDLAVRYSIFSIPTLMLFAGGQVAATISGPRKRAEILAALEPWL